MSSQFEVKLINIQRACINAEAAVKSYREAAFESAVRADIPRKFFRDRTREEAERYVRSDGDPFAPWFTGFWTVLLRGNELRAAIARAEGDTAWLDADDAAFVAKWEDS